MDLPESALEFLASLIGKSKNTKKTYLIAIKKFHSYINKEDFNESDVLRYLTELEFKGMKPSTLRLYAIILKKYLKFLNKNASKIPIPSLKNEPKQIYIKEEDLQKFLSSFDNLRDKIIVRLLLFTGCRVGEIANLHVEDIDFSRRIIKIVDHGHYEIKRPRLIPVDEQTLAMLKEYLGSKKHGRIFDLSVRAIQKMIKKRALKAGLSYAYQITPHKLRHTMAIYWITKGGDLRTLQRILGHSSIRTTEIYLDYDFNDIMRVYDKVTKNFINS